MTEQQISQILGQLQSSINKFEETNPEKEDYIEYCDNMYTCITYWRDELRKVKKLQKNEQ